MNGNSLPPDARNGEPGASTTPMLLTFADYEPFSRKLAESAGLDCQRIAARRFPDGESLIRLPSAVPEQIILCRSLDHPNRKLIELILASATARTLGARHVTLIAPYLCYMRQDHAFHPGEAVSQRIIGDFLARYFDSVVTVDPHLHRTPLLSQAIPMGNAVALSASAPIAAFLSRQPLNPILVGPDEESEQWLKVIAAELACPYRCARKLRKGDRDVEIDLPAGNYHARDVILIDDVASTGQTLITAAQSLRASRPRSVNVMVTHALISSQALADLRKAGVNQIWSTDTIFHETNAVSVVEVLADFVKDSY